MSSHTDSPGGAQAKKRLDEIFCGGYGAAMDIATRAALLRAARAWLALDQAEVADGVGLDRRTIAIAERGERLTDKSWRKLVALYATRGLVIEEASSSLSARP